MQEILPSPKRNKIWAGIIAVSVLLFAIKIINYREGGIFLIDISLLSFVFAIIIKFRRLIAKKIGLMRLPQFVLYLIVAVPFIIFEENINCLPSGCVIIPETLPILFLFVLILGLFVKLFKAKKITTSIVIFAISGVLFEIFAGGLKGDGLISPVGIFFLIWTALAYAFLVIVPLTILTRDY